MSAESPDARQIREALEALEQAVQHDEGLRRELLAYLEAGRKARELALEQLAFIGAAKRMDAEVVYNRERVLDVVSRTVVAALRFVRPCEHIVALDFSRGPGYLLLSQGVFVCRECLRGIDPEVDPARADRCDWCGEASPGFYPIAFVLGTTFVAGSACASCRRAIAGPDLGGKR